MLFLYVQMGKTGPNSYLLVLQYCTFLNTINRSWYIYIQILLSKIKYKKKNNKAYFNNSRSSMETQKVFQFFKNGENNLLSDLDAFLRG